MSMENQQGSTDSLGTTVSPEQKSLNENEKVVHLEKEYADLVGIDLNTEQNKEKVEEILPLEREYADLVGIEVNASKEKITKNEPKIIEGKESTDNQQNISIETEAERLAKVDEVRKNLGIPVLNSEIKEPTEALTGVGLQYLTDEEYAISMKYPPYCGDRHPMGSIGSIDEKTTAILKKRKLLDSLENFHGNFEDLYKLIDTGGGINDGISFYSTDRIRQIIDDIRTEKDTIESIPDVFGLRETVTTKLADETLRDYPSESEGADYSVYFIKTEHSTVPVYVSGEVKMKSISEGEWKRIKQKHFSYPFNGINYGESTNYPPIGAEGLRTKFGVINGPLVWCDTLTAVFDTPQGYLMVPFEDLLGPLNKSYKQAGKEERNKVYEAEAKAKKKRLGNNSRSAYE